MIRLMATIALMGLAVAGCAHDRGAPAEDSRGPAPASGAPQAASPPPTATRVPEAAAPAAPAPEATAPSPPANPQTGAAAGWKLPVPDQGYSVREGRTLFRHYCLTCHGEAGHGDGFNAYNLDPKPRDLADPAFQAKRSDDDLLAVIRSGGGAAGLSTGMPPWGRTLNDREIRNIVHYLRVLPEPSE
jgi:mono/diheme cytochrome c family protein